MKIIRGIKEMKGFKKERGVTLIELLIALVLSSVIIIGLGSIYITVDRTVLASKETDTLPSNVQLTVDQMAREIRLAKYIWISADGRQIRCKIDDGAPGDITTVDRDIGYIFYPNADLNESKIVYRTDWNDINSERTITTNVETLEFEEETPDPANVVKITLVIRREEKDSGGTRIIREWETSVSTTVNLRCAEGVVKHDPSP